MYIRTLVLSAIFLLTSIAIQAQTAEEIFERDIITFMNSTSAGAFDAVLDLTYPKLFTILPREQMKEALSQMLSNPEMQITVQVKGIDKIYDPIVEGTETFRRIDYNGAMQMKLGDEMWEQKDVMMAGIKSSMGAEDVTADEDTQAILINQVSTMIAIQQEGTSDWKYLQYQSDNPAMLKALIPEIIIEKMFESK